MNIAIFGLGLIGGSIGRALIKFTDNTVFGRDIDESVMLKAELLGVYNKPLLDEDLSTQDIVVFSLPPEATIEVMAEICPKLKSGAIVIDTCGIKRIVVDKMRQLNAIYPSLRFVGVHPMAGREFSGVAHSTATLFENAYIIMTAVTNDIETLHTIKKLFIEIGAQDVTICSAEKHDKMISYTSQLAHIVSSSYIKNSKSHCHAGFSAGSFRDMTRVAKLNPQLWTELFMENRDNLIGDIDELVLRLQEYREALNCQDQARLCDLLADGVKQKEEAENARKERLK
ncbi:MAG: prephenate dehydrogenase [Clostridia bacterium]